MFIFTRPSSSTLRRINAALFLLACSQACSAYDPSFESGEPADAENVGSVEAAAIPIAFKPRLQIVVVAPTGQPIYRTGESRANVAAAAQKLKTFYANYGIEFQFNSSTDIAEVADSDLWSSTANSARKLLAKSQEYPNKVVVFLNEFGPQSGPEWKFAISDKGSAAGALASEKTMAHEVGHYLHLDHTGADVQLTSTELAQNPSDAQRFNLLKSKLGTMIRDYVVGQGRPISEGLNVFDTDRLSETPPDPGPQLFEYANAVQGHGRNKCGPVDSVVVTVTISGQPRSYTIRPSRSNVMSYFQCAATDTIVPQQTSRNFGAFEIATTSAPGVAVTGDPASSDILAKPRLTVLATRPDCSLFMKQTVAGFAWDAKWRTTPGNGCINSAPTLVPLKDGGMVKVIRGSDSKIYVQRVTSASAWDRTWTPIPGGQTTDAGPSAIEFNGRLVVAVRALDGRVSLQQTDTNWKTTPVSTWVWNSGWNAVPGASRISSAPSLAFFNNHLIVVGRDTGDRIMLQAATTSWGWNPEWSEAGGGGRTAGAPSAAVFNGELIVAVRGQTDERLFYTRATSSWNWLGWFEIPGGGTSSNGPTIAVFDGRLVVLVKGSGSTPHLFIQQATSSWVWNSAWNYVPDIRL